MVGGVELILGFIPTSSRELEWGRLSVDVSRKGFPTWTNYLIERRGATVVLRSVGSPSAKLFQLD